MFLYFLNQLSMKNILILSSFISTVFIFSCKKDATTTVTPIPTDGWTLGTKTYRQNFIQRDTTNGFSLVSYHFNDIGPKQGEGWGAMFGSYPKFSGNYTISKNYLTGGGVGINELVIFSFSYITGVVAGQEITNTYFSTASDAPPVQVAVTITNGKITLSLPQTWVRKADIFSGFPVFANDSLKITGTMIEN